MEFLPLEILQMIFEYLDFKNKIILKLVCNYFYRGLVIYDLYNIDNIYLARLTDEIIKSYPYLKYLDASYNSKITGITVPSTLIKLNITNNQYFVNLTNLTELTELRAGFCFGLKNQSIEKCLKLEYLYLRSTPNVTSIRHLTKLKFLDISGASGVGNEELKYCNQLVRLKIASNINITDLNCLRGLKKLNLSNYCLVENSGIMGCTNLRVLNLNDNNKIVDINHLINLEKLAACDDSISDKGFKNCVKLRILKADRNRKIKDINSLVNLKLLSATYSCGLSKGGIEKCLKLSTIIHQGNRKI